MLALEQVSVIITLREQKNKLLPVMRSDSSKDNKSVVTFPVLFQRLARVLSWAVFAEFKPLWQALKYQINWNLREDDVDLF